MSVANHFFGGAFGLFGVPKAEKKKRVNRLGGYLAYLRKWAEPNFSYEAKHLQLVAGVIDRMISGEVDRVRIHMPPRHAKTTTVTAQLPCYLLERDPTTRILITVHTAQFGRRLGRKIRNLCKRRGINLSKDNQSATSFSTDEGGSVIICGVGAPPTGEGFDWIIIDDPIKKREQADSLTFREKLDDWYTEEIYTRLEPGGKVIGIWTLWHEDDLAGRLDERGRSGDEDADVFTVIKLPAIAGENDALGRQPGEALWPERIPLSMLKRIRANMMRKSGLRGWEALYQQNPTPLDGDIFKPSMIEIVKSAPLGLTWVRAWDAAASDGASDYTAGVLMAEDASAGIIYVQHGRRGQWDTGKRDRRIVDQAESDGEDVVIVLPHDPAAGGKSQTVYWSRMLKGYRFVFFKPKGSKVARAEGFSAQVNAGNVKFVRGSWNDAMIEELRTFPSGTHDDYVDALGDAYRQVIGNVRRLGTAY